MKGASTRSYGILTTVLGLVAVALSFAALNSELDWGVRYGDLGTWVGGLGSAAAASAAFVTLQQLFQDRREAERARGAAEEEARGRALRRAARIKVEATSHFSNYIDAVGNIRMRYFWILALTNGSDRPVYDVKFEIPLGVVERSELLATTQFKWGNEPSILDHFPPVEPGDSAKCEVQLNDSADEFVGPTGHRVIPFVQFTDEDGYAFCLDWSEDFRGIRPPQWAIKDANRQTYPYDAGLEHYREAAKASVSRSLPRDTPEPDKPLAASPSPAQRVF